MTKNKTSILIPVIVIIIGFLLAFIIAEVTTRLFFDQPVNPRFIMDSGYGIRDNQPNIVTYHYSPNEYEVKITTNSAGMRGQKEYSIEKPENVYRIALVGDSFVYGFGVEDNDVASARLEALLNNSRINSDKKFEVLNFGVAGFGQAEQLILYRNKIKKYNPDEVVLFYFNNDIGNNAVSNLFRMDQQGKIERTGEQYLPGVKARELLYSIAPLRWLSEYSRAWNLIRNRASAVVQRHLLKKEGMKSFDESTPESFELTRVLIKEFINQIKRDNAHPTLFVIPHRTLQSNFPVSRQEVEDFGTDFIDGIEFLEQKDYYPRDSHWTVSGNNKVSDAIAEHIVSRFE